jgi:2,4-dienoyl-CoA reductase-like NADH-dependent reductase (Old Yellow Enzyme family)/thioredoxin reductase
VADELDVLWQPLALPGTVLPNRIMTTATTVQYGVAGMIDERHVHFYRERARGGVGLIFTEQLTATPLSDTGFPTSISAHDERQIERLAMVREALEPYPSRFFGQLVAGGAVAASTGGLDSWGPARGPSEIGVPGGERTLALRHDEIAQIVADFARSAGNIQAAGLHGVEVHGSHGWLIGQFLSRFYNRREDAYGGSVEHRCRLALEIGRAVRAVVGVDYPIGLALTYDEAIGEAGITLADTLAQLAVLADAGVYDFYDLSIGAGHSTHLTISSMTVPEGYAIAAAAQAKAVLGDRAPVFVAGRIVDLGMAARAVADGSTDIVGMTRAHLADPQLVRKAREGRAAETTRCIGANTCVGRALRAQQVACVLTPATGREATLGEGTLQPVASAGSVIVVGAGPAGLRTGATAAARGYEVVVHEREAWPGGHIADMAWLPTRDRWFQAVEDLVSALERNGGRLELGSQPTAEQIAAGRPDAVVIATGADWEQSGVSSRRPDRPSIPGGEGGRVLGLGDALARAREDASSLGRRVVIADESGTYPALGLAEALALAGAEVHFVSASGSIGNAALASELELPHLLPRLRRLGVTLTVSHDIDRIEGRRVLLHDSFAGAGRQLDEVDTVVLALGRVPRLSLFRELEDMLPRVRLVGDARSPRSTEAVIHEAELLARAL